MIYCTLKLYETDHPHDNYVLLFKKVNWPCAPVPRNQDMRVSLGLDENGEETGWSIVPNAVWFESNGDILIELEDDLNPKIGDSLDKFVQYAKNDDFVDYDEWKKIYGN